MAIALEQHGTAPANPRITLLDTLRGVALLAMATYHFSWDLEFFGYLDPGTAGSGWLKIYARCIAGSFLFLAGVSLVLAHYPNIRWRPFWKRFAMVAGAALLISIGTRIAMPEEWIFFGILHAMATFSVIGLLFLRLPAFLTALVGTAIVAAQFLPRSEFFDTPWLLWVGLSQTPPRSNDYVPFVWWLGIFLLGMAVARLARDRNWLVPLSTLQTRQNIFSRGGRHSLIFYLVHQPVLIGLVYLATLVSPPPAPDPVASYIGSCERGCVAQQGDPGMCTRFCGCTLTKLNEQNLFAPLQSGAINMSNNEYIQTIASECSIIAQ